MSVRKKMQEDRQDYYNFFGSRAGFKCFRSDANFVLVRLPAQIVGPLREFLNRDRVEIKFFSEPGFDNFVRITIGTREQNKILLSKISEFISPNT
jgi:histidinol-phosphate aminotransferase